MEEELNLEKQILDELADVIGIDKSVIIDYAKYCELKSTGSLVDLGNCNFMIKTTKNYLDQSRITGALRQRCPLTTLLAVEHFRWAESLSPPAAAIPRNWQPMSQSKSISNPTASQLPVLSR